MRLYVDQMLRREIASTLRHHGHDVVRAEESGQARADDAEILDSVCREQRVLITLDEHFGDWVVLPLSQHPGVIRLKIHPPTPNRLLHVLVPFLSSHDPGEFTNKLVILSPKRVRWIQTFRSS